MKQISFTRGVPPNESIPVEKIAECAHDVTLQAGPSILQYAPAAGYAPLRQLIAERRDTSAENVVLGQGSLQILDILLHDPLQPGDVVAVEQPTYDRVLKLIRRAGLRILPIDLEDDGLNIEQLEEALRQGEKVRLIYVIPDFQNPTGRVMSLQKRVRLGELAQQYGFQIVEDSPYRALRYAGEKIRSIYELYPSQTIQLSSFSKIICPGLRVGYALLPPDIARHVCAYAEDTYINPSYLNQAIVQCFIERGYLDSHLCELKDRYRQRLDVMQAMLEKTMTSHATWTPTQGGFFIGLFLNGVDDNKNLITRAKQVALNLSNGAGFFVEGGKNFIRLPFCSVAPQDIEEGIQRLASVIQP